MKPPPLTYLSEQDRAWAKALRAADTLVALKRLCAGWGEWVPDARAVADRLTEQEFGEFRKGLLAKTDNLTWAAHYGCIAVPARLLEISMIAHQFHAPFGTAAIRHEELGGAKTRWLKKVAR